MIFLVSKLASLDFQAADIPGLTIQATFVVCLPRLLPPISDSVSVAGFHSRMDRGAAKLDVSFSQYPGLTVAILMP